MKTINASCLCRRVQLGLNDNFLYMGNCHCSECRKFTGSDYSSAGGLKAEDVEILQGKESIACYDKSEETSLFFCKHCGSSLYSFKHATQIYNIRLGILDGVSVSKPRFHIHTASKASWVEITDNLKVFENNPS